MPLPRQVGARLPAWMYEAGPSGVPCVDLIAHLVPASAVGRSDHVVGECLVDQRTTQRLTFGGPIDGGYALERAQIVVLASEGSWPTGDVLCAGAPIFPADGDPAEARRKGSCAVEVVPRDQPSSDLPLVWMALPPEAAALDIPPSTACSALVPLYSGGLEGATPVPALCTLR